MPTTTPHLGLDLPDVGSTNWNVPVNDNFSTIDTAIGSLSAEVAAVTTPVASVFGRTGAVTAESGDYSFSEISGTVSPSQLPVVPLSSLSGVVPIANGGTGASDAVDGRENLGAAVSGVNDDITQLTGLTSIIINGSQAITGVAGTTGTKLQAASGTSTVGHILVYDADGNAIDGGELITDVAKVGLNNNWTGSQAFVGGFLSTSDMGVQATADATSSTNVNSPNLFFRSNYWNGSSAQVDTWDVAAVQGSGANPSSTLTFSHTGSSGAASVSVPALALSAATTVTSATAGTATALPAAPAGYVEIVVNGVIVKIPYYN